MDLDKKLDSFIEEEKENIKRDLARLVSIPSVSAEKVGEYTFGEQCARVLETALEIGNENGFECENIDYYCGSIMLSSDSNKEIGIVSHLDVVPAGDGWNYPCFELTEKDGLYIGRGTEDDKGPTIAALYALKFFKKEGIDLPFSLRMIMGCDEEMGMGDLPYYLTKKTPPYFSFTPDSGYPVCVGEKGIMGVEVKLCDLGGLILSFEGGNAYNSVCDNADAVIVSSVIDLPQADNITAVHLDENRIKISAIGRTAHAAYPEGSDNAIRRIAQYIVDNALLPDDSAEYKAMDYLAHILDGYNGKGLGISMSDDESGYLTSIGGRIYARDNVLIQNINIRYPVTKNGGEISALLQNNAREKGFEAYSYYDKEPYYFSPEKPEIRALVNAYKTVSGDTDETYTTGGGTYARAFPNTVAFGVTMKGSGGLLGDGRGGCHERDEYITIKELHDSIKIFVRAIMNLSTL